MGYHYYVSASTKTLAPCPVSPGDSHLYQSLGLSSAQLSKMEPLAQKFHGRLAELGVAMEGKKELFVTLLQEDGDPVRIENLERDGGFRMRFKRKSSSYTELKRSKRSSMETAASSIL
jgi:hypothetical protein